MSKYIEEEEFTEEDTEFLPSIIQGVSESTVVNMTLETAVELLCTEAIKDLDGALVNIDHSTARLMADIQLENGGIRHGRVVSLSLHQELPAVEED